MKFTNCPSTKNYKRKTALANLEKNLFTYAKNQLPDGTPCTNEYATAQCNRIHKEIAVLKSRITN